MSATHVSSIAQAAQAPGTFRRAGLPLAWRWLLAPLTLSDLAREGIANRGSFRFADHLYRNEPSGRLIVGRWLDRAFLRLPAGAAFRRRYLHARDAIGAVVRAKAPLGEVRVLTVPCGIPRDVVDMTRKIASESPALLDRVEYVGMDIDPAALDVAASFMRTSALRRSFHRGDALARDQYPAGGFAVVSSTGLAEFLDDEQLATLYRNLYDVLEPGGTLYTSATAADPLAAPLLRVIDLPTRYRPQPHVAAILGRLPWRRITYVVDRTGLQTFVTAAK
jgi:SAM-dependent methyltransferase